MVQRLKDQLDLTKKDLELERIRKAQEQLEAEQFEQSHRKLSAETQEFLQKLEFERGEGAPKSEGRLSRNSARSIEHSSLWNDLQIQILPSLSAGKFESYISNSEKKVLVDKDTQFSNDLTTEFQPQIVYKEVIKETPEKIVIRVHEVAYTVAFKPMPCFDFRSFLVETTTFIDPTACIRLHSLPTTTYTFSGVSKPKDSDPEVLSGPSKEPPQLTLIVPPVQHIQERMVISPLLATQKVEKSPKKFFIGSPRSSKPIKPSKKMNFNLINQQGFPSEANPNIEQGAQVTDSFSETYKEVNKTSFLCLDIDQGTLKEIQHLPYANDTTSINIRKILKSTKSNQVSRQKLERMKDSEYGDGDDASSKYHLTKEYTSTSHLQRCDTEEAPDDQSVSKLSQHSFIDFTGNEANRERQSPYSKLAMTARNKKSLLRTDEREIHGSTSAMVLKDLALDNFKEKKRMLNNFFEKKNQMKDKDRKPV